MERYMYVLRIWVYSTVLKKINETAAMFFLKRASLVTGGFTCFCISDYHLRASSLVSSVRREVVLSTKDLIPRPQNASSPLFLN